MRLKKFLTPENSNPIIIVVYFHVKINPQYIYQNYKEKRMILKSCNKSFSVRILTILLFVLAMMITGCKTGNSGGDEQDEKIPLPKPEISYLISRDLPTSCITIMWTEPDEIKDHIWDYRVERTMVREGVTHEKTISWRYERLENTDLYYDQGYRCYVDDLSLEPDAEYTYRVRVYGHSDLDPSVILSDTITVHTTKPAEGLLDYPKNLVVSPANDIRNALTVTWNPVEGATSYEVYFSDGKSKNGEKEFTKVVDVTETSYTKENLRNEKEYLFKVKAINDEKYSVFSAQAEGRVAKAENISKDKAYFLENGVLEEFYSGSENLWFKCIPQKGKLQFIPDCDQGTLSIFTEDGRIVVSGLRLVKRSNSGKFLNSNLDLQDLLEENGFVYKENTKVFYLRITKDWFSGFSIRIR